MKRSIPLTDRLACPYWRVSTLATALGICQATVYDWVKKGVLPQPMKIGEHVVMWDKQEVFQALSKHGMNIPEKVA